MDAKDITGHLILIMAPTGSGKGSLVSHVKKQVQGLYFAVSCTTRDKRPGECQGREYFFITEEEFREKIKNEEFLEWAEFSNNTYGTLKSEVVKRLQAGEIIINEIELQGIQEMVKIIPKEHRTIIYIDAGGWEVLKARAIARAPISEEDLELRHQRYLEEKESQGYADIILDNTDGDLQKSKKQIVKIVTDIIKRIKMKHR